MSGRWDRHTLTLQIEQWLDGTISEQALTELKAELLENNEALHLYVDMAEMHGLLAQSTSSQVQKPGNLIPIDRVIRRQKRKAFRVASFAAAAAILIGVITMTLLQIQEQPHQDLTFKTSPGTRFTLTHSETGESAPAGMTMQKGSRLELTQGTVELTFNTGVTSIVMAPADMTLLADNMLQLKQGTAWFHVPEGAEGFKVSTDELDIVDLGTKFGVIATLNDYDEVHVFQGKVEVSARSVRKESATLTLGQSRKGTSIGRLDTIPSTPDTFLTSLPQALPHIRWSFDTDFQAVGTHSEVADITTTPHGKPALVKGKYGNALHLAGKRSHLITDWPGLPGDNPRTVTCWIRIPEGSKNTNFNGIVGWGNRTKINQKWKILVSQTTNTSPTTLRASWGDFWASGTSNLADNQWHHIAVTTTGMLDKHGNMDIQLYIDGIPEKFKIHQNYKNKAQISLDTDIVSRKALPLLIGSDLSTNPKQRSCFSGYLDEVTIYDGHMTPEEIKATMTPPPSTAR